jgi:hypothetical protein
MTETMMKAAASQPLPIQDMLDVAQVPDRIVTVLSSMERNLIFAVRQTLDDHNICWRNEECIEM